jgi:hypothetical protein
LIDNIFTISLSVSVHIGLWELAKKEIACGGRKELLPACAEISVSDWI